jgi:hypothetical protein
VSNRFRDLENLDAKIDINSAWKPTERMIFKIIRTKETSQTAVVTRSDQNKWGQSEQWKAGSKQALRE